MTYGGVGEDMMLFITRPVIEADQAALLPGVVDGISAGAMGRVGVSFLFGKLQRRRRARGRLGREMLDVWIHNVEW